MEIFLQLVISGLVNGSMYGLVAIGFVLIYKCSAVLNFAQGNMVLVTAYVFWTFKGLFGLGMLPSFVLSILLSFLFGMILERLSLRPLVGQPLLSMITVTIFLSVVLEGVTCIIWGSNPLTKVDIFPKGTINLGGFNIMTDNIFSFCFAVFVTKSQNN
jgi:branched-chain amino acid transport system permease protein